MNCTNSHRVRYQQLQTFDDNPNATEQLVPLPSAPNLGRTSGVLRENQNV